MRSQHKYILLKKIRSQIIIRLIIMQQVVVHMLQFTFWGDHELHPSTVNDHVKYDYRLVLISKIKLVVLIK